MNKYYIYKHIFSGATTPDDIIFLRSKCPESDYKVIDCVCKTLTLHTCMGYEKVHRVINKLTNFEYKEDCQSYLDKITNANSPYHHQVKTCGCETKLPTLKIDSQFQLQKNVFDKIKNSKYSNPIYATPVTIEKRCPHCGNKNSAPVGTYYKVCGIDVAGILPIANSSNFCYNDWCFTCGKKLCKNWYKHKLYIDGNQKHTRACCAQHASDNKFTYPGDYCQCVYPTIDDLLTDDFFNF